MNDGTLVMGGHGVALSQTFPRPPVTPFVEPPPALVTGLYPEKLLRGAWLWVGRKVLGFKLSNDDKGQFALRRQDALDALAIFKEKNIAPAAWLAWRAKVFVHEPTHMPGLGWMIGVSLLSEPARRGWFRHSTAGVFGGRVAPTKTQIEIMRRYAIARSAWVRGLEPSHGSALCRVGLDPQQLDMLLVVERAEVERARVRCATRASGGDPMAVTSPCYWTFHIKEPS